MSYFAFLAPFDNPRSLWKGIGVVIFVGFAVWGLECILRWPVGVRAVLGLGASAAEIMLFDRRWYSRAGVEHVMGFCSSAQYQGFLRVCSEIERMVISSEIHLI